MEEHGMAAKTERKENPVHIPVRWMRVEKTVQYLRVSTDLLNKARITKISHIPFSRTGHSIFYDRHALDKFLESLKQI
jgi:hypothetical protein